ncbi:Aldo/keto reductase [Auriculariales sp. MPI-PUGE-AT-0066]|nr:Aldo/keto reductase [Auriculariales sp. MPI-PUGE-AT-0066]
MPWDPIKLNDGRSIPSIAYGTWKIGNGDQAVSELARRWRMALTTLVQPVAHAYRNQSEVGSALADVALERDSLFITSKARLFFFFVLRALFSNYKIKFSGRDDLSITGSLKQSLELTGLKYLDLYLIHDPELATPDPVGKWKELLELRDAGLTKSAGVSNYQIADLEKLKETKVLPAVNQIMLHPYVWAKQKALVEYCQAHGIVIEAYSALIPITGLPGGPLDKVLETISERTGASWDQILLAWVKAKGAVAVTTSSKKERLLGYLAAGDLLITDVEIADLDAAGIKGSSYRPWWKHVMPAVRTFAAVYLLSRMISRII